MRTYRSQQGPEPDNPPTQDLGRFTVAAAAKVSRAFLYKTPETRTMIEHARGTTKPAEAHRRTRRDVGIAQLRAENTRLRDQVRELSQRNAHLLGILREAKNTRP